MKTLKEWQTGSHGDFDSYVNQYDEIDGDLYWYFLEILPPIYCNNGFLVSEAYSYCDAYQTQTYSCYIKYCDKFYWLGNISPKAVSNETENLLNRLNVKAGEL